MTKKKLKEILDGAVVKPQGLVAEDATLVRGNHYVAIKIYWQGSTHRSTIDTMKGRETDVAVIERVRKYSKWALELGRHLTITIK